MEYSEWFAVILAFVLAHDPKAFVEQICRFVCRWFPQPPCNVVIAICGKKESGKDTACNIIRLYMLWKRQLYFKHKTFAEPLKNAVQALTDCSSRMVYTHDGKESRFRNLAGPDRVETYRDVLKSVGKATRPYLAHWIRSKWANSARPTFWVISDLRLKDELDWIRSLQGTQVFVVRVNGPQNQVDMDISETSVDAFSNDQINFTIDNTERNDDMKQLKQQCVDICDRVYSSLFK
jgi:hypothetical protein